MKRFAFAAIAIVAFATSAAASRLVSPEDLLAQDGAFAEPALGVLNIAFLPLTKSTAFEGPYLGVIDAGVILSTPTVFLIAPLHPDGRLGEGIIIDLDHLDWGNHVHLVRDAAR